MQVSLEALWTLCRISSSVFPVVSLAYLD